MKSTNNQRQQKICHTPPLTAIRKTFQAQGTRISYSKAPKIRNRGPARGAGIKKWEVEVGRSHIIHVSFIYVSHLSSMFSHWIVNLEMLIFLMDALIYSGLSCSIHPVITFIFYVYVYFFVASAPTFSVTHFWLCLHYVPKRSKSTTWVPPRMSSYVKQIQKINHFNTTPHREPKHKESFTWKPLHIF